VLAHNSSAWFVFRNQSFTTVSVCPSPAAAFFFNHLDLRYGGAHVGGPRRDGLQVAVGIDESPRVVEADAAVLLDNACDGNLVRFEALLLSRCHNS
jgi:hypothetical protein